jgi:hypothetical protein
VYFLSVLVGFCISVLVTLSCLVVSFVLNKKSNCHFFRKKFQEYNAPPHLGF